MSLSLAEAQLANLFAESICYGIYLVTVGFAIPVLLRIGDRWKTKEEIKWFVFLAATALWVNSTFNLTIAIYRALRVYVHSPDPETARGRGPRTGGRVGIGGRQERALRR